MGRKKLHIDWEQVKKLCAIQCTRDEIAAFCGISNDTLERAIKREYRTDFAAYYALHSATGRRSLRRKQMEIALQGNPQMLKWMGQQLLGQSDKQTTVNKTELDARVQTIDKDEIRKANEELESEC